MADTPARCTATRKDGTACTLPAIGSGRYCFAHDERARTARATGGKHSSLAARAGRHLPPHLAAVQTVLIDLIDEVRKGAVEPQAATAIATITARLLDLARFSVELSQRQDLEQRLQDLEAELGRLVHA